MKCPGGSLALVLGAFILMALAAAGPASAEDIDAQGLELDLGVAPHCVMLPRTLRAVADCQGQNAESMARQYEAQVRSAKDMVAVALIRWTADNVMMTAVAMPPSQPSPQAVGDMLAGFYNSTHRAAPVTRVGDPRIAHDEIVIAGTPAVRYTPDVPGVVYIVFGANRAYRFFFLAPNTGAARALGDKVMATVALPPLAVDPNVESPTRRIANLQSSAYELGKLMAVLFVGLAISLFFIRRLRRR